MVYSNLHMTLYGREDASRGTESDSDHYSRIGIANNNLITPRY